MTKRYGGRRAPVAPQVRLTATPEEIMARTPLLQALGQMDSGWEGERGPRPRGWFWYECPELKPIPPQAPDLRGRPFGRMVVVGMLDHSRSGGAAWVVRCGCGRFETRTARAIRRAINPIEACQACDYIRHIKRRAVFDRTGKWPEQWLGA